MCRGEPARARARMRRGPGEQGWQKRVRAHSRAKGRVNSLPYRAPWLSAVLRSESLGPCSAPSLRGFGAENDPPEDSLWGVVVGGDGWSMN